MTFFLITNGMENKTNVVFSTCLINYEDPFLLKVVEEGSNLI
jgi:hypothetical protein